MTDGRFWAEDFDADLFRAVPDARHLFEPFSGVRLYTYGQTTNGRLNHPCLWNGDRAMIAFFGLKSDGRFKPPFYVPGGPGVGIVECTVAEAFRDLWVHSAWMILDGALLWDSWRLRGDFDALMAAARGWPASDRGDADGARRRVRLSVAKALARLRVVIDEPGGGL